jgi:hypothetical protein
MDGITKQCEYCGKTFSRNTSHATVQRFCSTACWYQWKRDHREYKACEMCGKPSRAGARFCSNACYGQWKATHVTGADNPNWRGGAEHVCKECGKAFLTRPCHKNRAQYCGRACRERAYRKTRIVKTCERCGRQYVTYASLTDRSRFCSAKCKNEALWEQNTGPDNHNWKGGKIGYRGRNWYAQARKARIRDNYTCQRCGITQELYGRSLDVHHIVPFREFGVERYKEANALPNLLSLCSPCHRIVEWQVIESGDTAPESRARLSVSLAAR